MGKKPGLMLYHERLAMLGKLPDAECGRIAKAMFCYSMDGIVPDFSDDAQSVLLSIVWDECKRDIDTDAKRYAEKCQKNRDNANRRWGNDATVSDRIQTHTTAQIGTKNDAKNANYQLPTYNNISCPELPNGNGTKEKKKKPIYSQDSYAYKCAEFLSEKIAENFPKLRSSTENEKQAWADDFDKCNRIDGHKWEQIEELLVKSQNDDFWKRNIRSGKKFRAQYDELVVRLGVTA